MATIDDKVVAMSFESSKFESGVNKTISALDKLKASLHFPNSGKELNNVAVAAKRVDLSHIGQGIDAISQKLGYFSVASLAIFANLATQAVRTGAQLAKAFTIDPMKAGFAEYSTNLNSIQTILANTQASGATLKDVNAALDELNDYSDKTIYNFGQMARNIGTFTAAGVDLKTATASIKGIANLAALSGSNAEQASTAMYQLSQAISSGSVKLMDWNSVVNAGMGGTVFQRALAMTGENMGKLKKGTVELVGPMKNVKIAGESFRNSLSAPGKDGWLTSDVLTTTLKMLTGDMTDAELRADGWNEAQIKAIQQQAKTAMLAATNVKTLSQVLDVAKETAGSGWAKTWRIIFGDFEEAKKTFTALSNAVNGIIIDSARARNNVLGDWKALGGRTQAIEAIKIAFNNLGLILQPIKDAFRDIFPAKTGKDLFKLTMQFKEFAKALKPSAETVANLKRTFAGVFAIFSIGVQIVKGIFTVFKELFGALGGGSGGFLSLTASIGDFFVSIDKALKKGDRLHEFFVSLGKVLAVPVELLSKIAGALGDAFSNISFGGLSSGLNDVSNAMTPLQVVTESLASAWNKLMSGMSDAIDVQAIIEGIAAALTSLGTAIGNAAANMNFEVILDVIKTSFFGALVLMFKQFLGRGSFLQQVSKGFGKGILGNISGAFDGLSGSMKAMQQNLRAKTLKEIAIAIVLLAGALLMISLIKPERLNASLGAITILFGELIAAMALLDKIAHTGGFLKLPIIIAGLIGLAIAIDLLTLAVLAMSLLSWEELLRGLGGVGALLAGISIAVKPLSANSAGLIRASIGIGILAVALNLLALAVHQFGAMSWTELAKGLAAVAISLKVFTIALGNMPESGVALRSTIGIIALAVALKILASAITDLSKLTWEELYRGLIGVAAGLGAMVIAMQLMPENIGKNAAGLLLVAAALWVMSDAIVKMGAMSVSEMAKGLIALGGAMLILVKGMNAIAGSLKGAAALGIIAVSLALLAPALVMLGKQSWGNIIKSLVALAGGLVIVGLAGKLLTPAIPALLGLGIAVALVGAGIALAGAGMFLFAAGLSAVAIAAPTAVGILIAAFKEWLLAIPEIAASFALAILSIVEAFAKTAPQFVDAIVEIINSLLDVIIKSSPKIAEAFTALISMALKVLADNQAPIIAAGLSLLLALLQGIKANISKVTTMVVDIIVTFLQTIANNLGRIIKVGIDILISLLNGIGDNLAKVVTAAISIISKFISAIIGGLGGLPAEGLKILTKLLSGIADNLKDAIKAGAKVIVKVIEGITDSAIDLMKAGRKSAAKFMTALAEEIPKLTQDVFDAVILLINGMAAVINDPKNQKALRDAGGNLAFAVANGLTLGLAGKLKDVGTAGWNLGKRALKGVSDAVDSKSPSKEAFIIGQFVADGLSLGISTNASGAYAAATTLSNGIIGAFNNTFQTNSPSKVMMEIGKFVGQGFAMGLRGSKDDINGAFVELNEMLSKAIITARETIASEQEKLDKLRKEKKPDTDAIKKSQAIIDQNEDLLKKSIATRRLLTKNLADEHSALIKLSTKYDQLGVKLSEALNKMKELEAERVAMIASFKDKYSTTPDLSTPMTEEIAAARQAIAAEQAALDKARNDSTTTPEQLASAEEALNRAQEALNSLISGKVLDSSGNSVDILATYLKDLEAQTTAVAAYGATLDQLRKLGIDDKTYRKLVEEGTADQAFADQLLAGGKTAVQGLNKLDKQLDAEAFKLATKAGNYLGRVGRAAQKGLIKGLREDRNELRLEMEAIAKEMLDALKKALKQKSPSKEFEKIGGNAIAGLVVGLTKTNGLTNAMNKAADNALTAMKSSMAKISQLVSDELNPSLVLTPILDLSRIQSQSGELARLTNLSPITAAASYGQAAAISSEQNTIQLEELNKLAALGPSVKFEQNNYSPKALSDIEIYRQTKNQLSQVKSLLGTS